MQVPYLECDAAGYASQRPACQASNIRGYPTWQVRGGARACAAWVHAPHAPMRTCHARVCARACARGGRLRPRASSDAHGMRRVAQVDGKLYPGERDLDELEALLRGEVEPDGN